jgi:hypothetical protein
VTVTALIDADWELFADWCSAAEMVALPASPETVNEFVRSTPARASTVRRRLRAIRHVHQNARQQLPIELPARSTTIRVGEGWVPIARALAQLPTLRFPVGLRGRRDGWLLVLIGVLGMSRREALAVRTHQIQLSPDIQIAGRTVPRTDSAAECPSCAVTRWLRVVRPAAAGFRATVKEILDPAGVDDTAHDCAVELDGSWRTVRALAISIDRNGWVSAGHPISLTAVSAIMTARQRPAGEPLRGFVWSPATGRFKDSSSAELAAAYDEVDRRVAELLKRSNAVLTDGAEMLGEIEGHWGR